MNFSENQAVYDRTKPDQAEALTKMLNMSRHYGRQECTKSEFCAAIKDYLLCSGLIDQGFEYHPVNRHTPHPVVVYNPKADKTLTE